MNKHIILILLATTLLNYSCKKFLQLESPPTSVTKEFVFSTNANATSSMIAIYSKSMESTHALSGGSAGISKNAGLAADEITDYSQGEIERNAVQETNALVSRRWSDLYKCIYNANMVIEGVNGSNNISIEIKAILNGEAKFFRAFCYFYLVNTFGDVPLLLSTDYRINAIASRTPKDKVYQQIISDLKDAQNQLTEVYLDAGNNPTIERLRPNKAAATAMLSRVLLYLKDYKNAEIEASKILDNTSKFDTVALADVFIKNSKETIWQLQPPGNYNFTFDGNAFYLVAPPSPVSLQNASLTGYLLNTFEKGDKRRTDWVASLQSGINTYYFPVKYKNHLSTQPRTEYMVVLRVAEQYLIRAEARINQIGKIAKGIEDLNIVRKRARSLPTTDVPDPLPPLSLFLSQEQALRAVEQERRVELFTEWGHRWFDLHRTERADAVLGSIKGIDWQSSDKLWPVPLAEIGKNSNLKPQNPGYN